MKKRATKKTPAKKAASKSKSKAKPKARTKAKAKPKPKAKTKAKTKAKAAKKPSWSRFVEKHGVVLASARGPVPSVAEAIVGEPIVGSWWSHPKGQQIFDALSTIDDDRDNIRCFKLVDHKVTYVHKRLWPAVAKLAQAGVLDADRVASIQQEHMPTGEHRNVVTPFPDWVPDDAMAQAAELSVDDARAQLGAWV